MRSPEFFGTWLHHFAYCSRMIHRSLRHTRRNIFVYFPLHFRTPVFQHGASLVFLTVILFWFYISWVYWYMWEMLFPDFDPNTTGWSLWHACFHCYLVNILRPIENGRHSADNSFKRISFKETLAIKISLKFVSGGPILIFQQWFS